MTTTPVTEEMLLKRIKGVQFPYPFVQGFDPRYAHQYPFFTWSIIQSMLLDSRIRFALWLIKGPIVTYTKFFSSAETKQPGLHQALVELDYAFPYQVICEDPEIEEFVLRQMKRFWEVGASKALTALEWGYSGSQVTYKKAPAPRPKIPDAEGENLFAGKDAQAAGRNDAETSGNPPGIKMASDFQQNVPYSGNDKLDKKGTEPKFSFQKSQGPGKELIHFDNLSLYASPWTIRPVVKNEGIIGMTVRASDKTRYIPIPKAFWHVHNREVNPYMGESRLKGAHIPWHETWTQGGARDIRRLWFFKNSYDGGQLYYPEGETIVNGAVIPNDQLAADMLSGKRTGGYFMFPNLKDSDGKPRWEYIPPESQVTPQGLMEYPEQLRYEILEGLGIPPEVIESQGDTGFGSATGRKVPFMAFVASLTPLVSNLIGDFNSQILGTLVKINFGKEHPEYRIEPIVPVGAFNQPAPAFGPPGDQDKDNDGIPNEEDQPKPAKADRITKVERDTGLN
jgi:hypothetical protein